MSIYLTARALSRRLTLARRICTLRWTVPDRSSAEMAATDLLRATWHDDSGDCPLPVDPFRIASALGLRVNLMPLEPDVSGMLAKRPYQDPEVYINANDSRNRQRFSCAHEIGHYDSRASNRDDDSWGYIDRRGPSASKGSTPDEIYANQFAAALLMPEEKVKELHGQIGPAAMAVEFGVSLEAMLFRIDNLDLSRTPQAS